jgi:hypothetical protein
MGSAHVGGNTIWAHQHGHHDDWSSFLNGADDCAPIRVTDIDAAVHAVAIAPSQWEVAPLLMFPLTAAIASSTTNAPLKTSPAAVVSTGLTFGAGTKKEVS